MMKSAKYLSVALLLLATVASQVDGRTLHQQQQQRATAAPTTATGRSDDTVNDDTVPPAADSKGDIAVPPGKLFIFGYGSLLSQDSTTRTNCGLAGLREDNISGLRKVQICICDWRMQCPCACCVAKAAPP
jgi:hypothetical protein